jgi:hypothetical protein
MTNKMQQQLALLAIAFGFLGFGGLWYIHSTPAPNLPKNFLSAKIVKVLYHDTLFAALHWPSGKINRLWQEYRLAKDGDDWPFCCDMDSALQWAWDNGTWDFEQYHENGTVDYYRIAIPGMPFEVITPLKATKYEPKVMGWAHISSDSGGYWGSDLNLHLSCINYCMSVDQDSATLSDSAIYRRLHHLPSPIIY